MCVNVKLEEIYEYSLGWTGNSNDTLWKAAQQDFGI